jgi:branched-chain amino acid aminotransferase
MTATSFAERQGSIWLDGALVSWPTAQTHVLTHALHYGSAVFEGERVYGGRVFKLDLHTQRLMRSAQLLEFDIPFPVEEIKAATREVVEANQITEGYIRTIAWRGPEVMGIATAGTAIHLAIACWPWPSYWTLERRLAGLRLELARWKRPAPGTAPTASKASGLYMIASLAKDAAVRNGYDDALMLDYRGLVAEATGANICFLRGRQLHTPQPDCFLDGITRQVVEELAARRGFSVHRRAIELSEMATFEEAFLCGTAAEIAPVASIGDVRFKITAATSQLMADFTHLTQAASE